MDNAAIGCQSIQDAIDALWLLKREIMKAANNFRRPDIQSSMRDFFKKKIFEPVKNFRIYVRIALCICRT